MAKRLYEDVEAPQVKRQKLDGASDASIEAVTSVRQLQTLLTFQQDSSGQLRNGIKSFKAFLESILYTDDRSTMATQQAILREFLQAEVPNDVQAEDTPMLSNLMQAWSFAAQANNDSLVSSLSAVLALLLKTISTLIDFRDIGIQLCRTLLQQSQLKLISRSLASARQKEHIISPSLRLLTEITTFDGGVMAKRVFAAKTFTFDGKILSRNLSLWKPAGSAEDEKRRPAVRSNAIRFLLAHLRLQSSAAKLDILRYGNVIHALFEHIQHDPVDVLKEILDVLKKSVLGDDAIPRPNKGFIVNDHNLSSLANLCRGDVPSKDSEFAPKKVVHSFLLYVCTESKAGILRDFAGWYPPGAVRTADDISVDDDLYGQRHDKFKDKIPVRNTILASFVQTLRPTIHILDSELLLEIFQAAPELVADYFIKKGGFAFDPKLTATWIGYASFLFSAIQLPVPLYFGLEDDYGSVPPPTSIVLGNILPQPLTQAVLTRCLNQKVELISFFTIRILCQAIQKLQKVLDAYDDAGGLESPVWSQSSRTLKAAFIQRVPKLRDVINTFRKTAATNHVQREAVLRLIDLYYREDFAADEKFDISTPLAEELVYFDSRSPEDKLRDGDESVNTTSADRLRLLELDHMLSIAQQSPDMRWLHKTEMLPFSPLVMLLRLVSSSPLRNASDALRRPVLQFFVQDYNCLQNATKVHGVYALLASLASTTNNEAEDDQAWKTEDAVFNFLDDALSRSTRKLAKYEDDRDRLRSEHSATGPVSHFTMTLVEQLPFCKENKTSIATWIKRFLAACTEIGEDTVVIHELSRQVGTLARDVLSNGKLQDSSNISMKAVLAAYTTTLLEQESFRNQTESQSNPQEPPTVIAAEAYAPPTEDPKHSALHRWSTKPLPTALDDGDLSALILCLSSIFPEVRTRTLSDLRSIWKRLTTETSHPDAQAIELLLLCLINTIDHSPDPISTTPPTYVLTVYAALASRILVDPVHPLYEAINRFHLSRGPTWSVPHLLSYWTHKIIYTQAAPFDPSLKQTTADADSIILDPRTEDPALTTDISKPLTFLLNYIYHSLRTAADVQILHRRGTLEPVLGLAANPLCTKEVKILLLRILWRISTVEGGTEALVARKGVLVWLGMQKKKLIVDGRRRNGRKAPIKDEVLIGDRGIELLLERLGDLSGEEEPDEDVDMDKQD